MKLKSCCQFILLFLLLVTQSAVKGERPAYWKQRASFFETSPLVKGDIVMLGNSITDGGEFNELFPGLPIKNRGISGDVVSGIIERLNSAVSPSPSKIFLLIGINDISHGHSATQIASEYEELVKKIKSLSPQTELYLQSVMPIDNSFGRYKNLAGREDVIPALNGHISIIARKYGAEFIDLWPALSDSKGNLKKEYTNDGLHLMGAGYRAWANVLNPYIGVK